MAGEVDGGGVFQGAADGNSVTYSSTSSFGSGAQAAPAGSQYISTAAAGGHWSTENITVPIVSGSFGIAPEGVPYQLFSSDLRRGLLLSGRPCRSVEGICPVANPPLGGTEAPAGYQNYYLREAGSGFQALLGPGAAAGTDLDPAHFELLLAGATPDLSHAVVSSCAALAPGATEVPLGEGCDPLNQNLYEWSSASGLTLVNSSPGAVLAAQSGAISSNGARVYWSDESSVPPRLFLSEGSTKVQVDGAPGVEGGGVFQDASGDGSVAFFTKEGHLYRYLVGGSQTTDLTPAGEVAGVLGASENGAYVYYYAASDLYLWHNGSTTLVAAPPGGDPSPVVEPGDYPPATGSARVSSDGTHLVFLSEARLTGYDNTDQVTNQPDSEVFLYDSGAARLRCISCNPKTATPPPIGPSTIPGAVANGAGADATDAYKPRVLSTGSTRVIFESGDSLVSGDTNKEPDVYQWEAQGAGSCTKAVGCVELLSDGTAENGSHLVDASASGDDVFFVTESSLVAADPGSFDLYDARVGGENDEPLIPIPCNGDSCQSLLSEPSDPPLGTQVSGPGNPKVNYVKLDKRKHTKGRKQGKGNKHGEGHGTKKPSNERGHGGKGRRR